MVPSGTQRPRNNPSRKATRADIAQIAGELDDVKVAQIIASGATVEDLEEAAAWAAGETDVLGDARLRTSVMVQKVYDILTAEDQFPAGRE